MDDPHGLVRVVEPLRCADHNREGAVHRDASSVNRLAKHGPNVLAVQVFHRVEVLVRVVADLDETNDIGVLELGRDAGLLHEHRCEVGVLSQVRVDALEGDNVRGAVSGVRLGEVEFGHATDREAPDDLIRTQPASGRQWADIDRETGVEVWSHHRYSTSLQENVRPNK